MVHLYHFHLSPHTNLSLICGKKHLTKTGSKYTENGEIQCQADGETQGSLNWRESVKTLRSQKRKYTIEEGKWLKEEQESYINPSSQENPSTVIVLTPIKMPKISLQEKAYDAMVRIAENTQIGGGRRKG